MINKKIKKSYNKIADKYLKARDRFKSIKYLDKLTEKLPKNSKILDLGCGAGIPVDKYLVKKGYKVKGVDISEKQIELAKKNVPEANYQVKNMEKLEEKEYKVDTVISFYAIFHTPRKKHLNLLKKINSFLNPGGLLLITMGTSDWEGKESDFYGEEMLWSHYGTEKNKKLINQAGFNIIFAEVDNSGGEHHLIVLAKK